MNELREIMEKFALCGWKLICEPAQQWLDGEIDNGTIIPVIQEADKQCGSCGCEFDPLYKRALELLLCSCKENTLKKISIKASNTFCPQPLYLYGTYKEDGQPNYGLFCWCAYCAVDNLKFVACIGEDKLTRDRIRQTGMFSATIVTEELLSEADWCGTHSGYEFDKSEKIPSEKGAVLNVPVPEKGVWTLELKVEYTLHTNENYESDIYVCSIENVLAEGRLADEGLSFEEKLELVKPVVTMCRKYFPVDLKSFGDWGMLK